jgi:hypothetical protein
MRAASPDRALLVASVLGRDLELVDRATARFAEVFGRLIFASEPLAFEWTAYYGDELGPAPRRRVIAVDRLDDTSSLPEIKRAAGRIEVTVAGPGTGRPVNIDPGLLGAEQLVLASTKPRGHRLHLGRGIHGELTLLFGPEGFAPLPWTYPDYASPPLRAIFGRLRELLLERRRMETTP